MVRTLFRIVLKERGYRKSSDGIREVGGLCKVHRRQN
jgi:hypothetical protein